MLKENTYRAHQVCLVWWHKRKDSSTRTHLAAARLESLGEDGPSKSRPPLTLLHHSCDVYSERMLRKHGTPPPNGRHRHIRVIQENANVPAAAAHYRFAVYILRIKLASFWTFEGQQRVIYLEVPMNYKERQLLQIHKGVFTMSDIWLYLVYKLQTINQHQPHLILKNVVYHMYIFIFER